MDAILDVTNPGDIVLDGFLGSGSTLIAAERTRRICYGVELDPAYVDVTIQRWQRESDQQAVLADTGQTFDQVAAERGLGEEVVS
jgi:DNA modification methylase